MNNTGSRAGPAGSTCVSSQIPRAQYYRGIHYFNRKYIMPVEISLGFAGNIAILIVMLRAKHSKVPSSKFNLAAMALADALYLLLCTPQIFAVYDFATTSYEFMYAFVASYPTQVLIINSMDTASTW